MPDFLWRHPQIGETPTDSKQNDGPVQEVCRRKLLCESMYWITCTVLHDLNEARGLFCRVIFLQSDVAFFFMIWRCNREYSNVCTVTVQYYEVFAASCGLGPVDFLEVYFS